MATLADAINRLNQISYAGFTTLASLAHQQIAAINSINMEAQEEQASREPAERGPSAARGLREAVRRWLPSGLRGVYGAGEELFGAMRGLVGAAGEAEAAGGGGAGAGAAAGGAAAAAGASNPIGWIIAAVVAIIALGVAVAALPSIIQSWGQSLLDSQRKLGEFSAAIASIMLASDIRDMMRDIQVGTATAGTTADLADSLGDLKDAFFELNVFWINFKNEIFTLLAQLVIPVVQIATNILAILGIISGVPKARTEPLQNWVGQIARDFAEKAAAADRRFAHNPFAPGP